MGRKGKIYLHFTQLASIIHFHWVAGLTWSVILESSQKYDGSVEPGLGQAANQLLSILMMEADINYTISGRTCTA